MPWGAAVGAGIGLLGDAMKEDKAGGAGAKNAEPWAPAQPWLMSNILLGQGQQADYLANPIAPKVQASADNQYALSDYIRGVVPSLLGQMQGQPLGYDRTNPTAKAKAYDWSQSSLLGGQRAVSGTADLPAKAAAPVDDRTFIQQGNPLANWNNADYSGALSPEVSPAQIGGFGQFKYGMAMPKAGTQAYKDMSDYFAYGGADPLNRYGRAGSGGGGLLYLGGLGAPGEGEGPSAGAPGGGASAGPGGSW